MKCANDNSPGDDAALLEMRDLIADIIRKATVRGAYEVVEVARRADAWVVARLG